MPKRDEVRVPRRFETYGGAAWWVATTVGKYTSPLPGYAAVHASLRHGWSAKDLYAYAELSLVTWFILWFVVSVAIYLYYALGGGVMSREERRRKNLSG